MCRHTGTLPGRRYAICPRWCHTAFGARYQNRTGTYCLEGSRSAINLIRHTPARRRALRKEEVEKGGYESAQSVVNSTLCVHFTAILIVRSTFKWRNENFFVFSCALYNPQSVHTFRPHSSRTILRSRSRICPFSSVHNGKTHRYQISSNPSSTSCPGNTPSSIHQWNTSTPSCPQRIPFAVFPLRSSSSIMRLNALI